MRLLLLLLACSLTGVPAILAEDKLEVPPNLLIGAGLSALQAEGGLNMTGSIVPTAIDVAADHYHRYEEDLGYAKEMKLTTHRFSISWSRIFPTSNMSNPNPDGVEFYRKYIKKVIENGMTPLVTMLHFDSPVYLEFEINGWRSLAMVEKFVAYADFLFKTFGSEIKYWTTINEGNMYCGSISSWTIPSENPQPGDNNPYNCLHVMVIAHARVYRLYREKYFATQKGMVGASALLWPATPITASAPDLAAADVFNQIFGGTILHPVVYGRYPDIVRYIVDKRSLEDLGMKDSRLPKFSEKDRKLFDDGPAADFIAINVYSGFKVSYDFNKTNGEGFPRLLGAYPEDMMNVKVHSGGGFDTIDENLMKNALLWTWNNYHLPIVISENGLPTKDEGLQDVSRMKYIATNLRSLVRTMRDYKIPVMGYYAWALIDVWEFSAGFTERPFGIIHVDYSSKNLTRTPKESAKFFRKLCETRKIPLVSGSAKTSPYWLAPLLLSVAGAILVSK